MIHMEIISSISNVRVQSLRSLYTKKGRDEQSAYVVEGVNIVKDIPDAIRPVAYYFAAGKYDELRYVIKHTDVPVYLVADELFRRVVDTVTPSGVVAVLPVPVGGDYLQSDRLLVLDGVSDPGNVGTILRTAIAAGYTDVVLLGGADPYSPKVVRASMGGIYRLNVHRLTMSEWHWSHTVFIMDMAGESIYDAVPPARFALVVGNEALGISDAMRSRADRVLSVPMQGGIESLNVAVAAAIGMYQLNANARAHSPNDN